MPNDKKARLHVIDDTIETNETIIFDAMALLFDPGGGLKKREAEGYLVLTNRRLIFGTVWHGILVDFARKEFVPPASVTFRWTTARLAVETDDGTRHTFILSKGSARNIAFTLNKARPT